MASIVTEILSSAGQLQREELSDKINGLNGRIADLKIQLQDSLHSRYEQFHPICVHTTELASKLDTYSSEVQALTSLVDNELVPQVLESSEEFREVRRQLATATQTLQVVNRLIGVHDVLESSETSFVDDRFKDAVDSLDRAALMTDDLATSWGCRVQVLNGLKREHTVRREKLTYDLGEIWNDCVTFESISGESVRLSIHRSGGIRGTVNLIDLVQAMHQLRYLESKLKVFANRFHKQVLVPIVVQNSEVEVTRKGETSVLVAMVRKAVKGNPKEVFAKLTNVLDFLDASFGEIDLTLDSESTETISLMQLLGSVVCKEFYNLLIKECLLPAMPTRRKDFSSYTEVIETVTMFHKYLTNVGLVVPGTEEGGIVSYARNVEVIFANKTCKEILVKARKLILDDLYDSMIPPLSEHPSEPEIKEELELNKGLLRFPACHISKSTYDLVQLVYGVMEEATLSTPLGASRLFTTAKNVIDLYCDLVPNHHREVLEKLPQQSALLHNNCMYIVHHLRTLGQQFQSRLTDSLGHMTITFIEFIPILEKIGSAVFLDQMRNQKKQLVNMLDFTNMLNDSRSKPVAAERPIKQCILQLQHLQSVWIDVFPPNVYNRAIGTLINSLVDEIVRRVVQLEDLSVESATNLISIFGVLKDKAPLLFRVSSGGKPSFEIQRHVPKWSKFQELLLMLAASMVDILERWSEGKGPLAQEFAVDEVKQMIRALFQNTDRRAAVLSKIK